VVVVWALLVPIDYLERRQNFYHSRRRLTYHDQLFLFEQITLSRVWICESPFPARAGKFVTL
jgi:hypothetical protein